MPNHGQTLYRFFNANDELLYVGVTMNPPQRFRTHALLKEWWDEVDRIDLERHETRADVLAAEEAAIRTERPLHNVAMNSGTPVCDVCHRAIHSDPDDDPTTRHDQCDVAVCDAYMAGWQSGKEWAYGITLGERMGHKLVAAHCDGIRHAGTEHYREGVRRRATH